MGGNFHNHHHLACEDDCSPMESLIGYNTCSACYLKFDSDVSPLKYSIILEHKCIVIVYLGRILSWLITEPHEHRHFIFHECRVARSLTYTEWLHRNTWQFVSINLARNTNFKCKKCYLRSFYTPHPRCSMDNHYPKTFGRKPPKLWHNTTGGLIRAVQKTLYGDASRKPCVACPIRLQPPLHDPLPKVKTGRFGNTFVPYCLFNCQWRVIICALGSCVPYLW